jgi:hypothetical protein
MTVSSGNRSSLGECGSGYSRPRPREVIGLVGLPRSGTTILTAVLAVHSRIEAAYEPWNANQHRELPKQIDLNDFFEVFPMNRGDKEVLLVKETATHIAYLDNIAHLLRSARPLVAADLIIVFRDPLHVFLSEIEARRKWWGDAEAKVSAGTFDIWADRSLAATRRMIDMGREFDSVVIPYEALARDRETSIASLMQHLGLEFEEHQLNFEKHLAKERVRGDVSVATNPAQISDRSIRRRSEELTETRDKIALAERYSQICELGQALRVIEKKGVTRFSELTSQGVMAAIEGLLPA